MLTICFVDVPTEQNAVEEMLAVEASDTDPCVYHSLLHLHLQDLRLHAPLEWRPGRICPWNLCSHSSGQFQFQLKLELLFALRFSILHIEDLTIIPWRVMLRFNLNSLSSSCVHGTRYMYIEIRVSMTCSSIYIVLCTLYFLSLVLQSN